LLIDFFIDTLKKDDELKQIKLYSTFIREYIISNHSKSSNPQIMSLKQKVNEVKKLNETKRLNEMNKKRENSLNTINTKMYRQKLIEEKKLKKNLEDKKKDNELRKVFKEYNAEKETNKQIDQIIDDWMDHKIINKNHEYTIERDGESRSFKIDSEFILKILKNNDFLTKMKDNLVDIESKKNNLLKIHFINYLKDKEICYFKYNKAIIYNTDINIYDIIDEIIQNKIVFELLDKKNENKITEILINFDKISHLISYLITNSIIKKIKNNEYEIIGDEILINFDKIDMSTYNNNLYKNQIYDTTNKYNDKKEILKKMFKVNTKGGRYKKTIKSKPRLSHQKIHHKNHKYTARNKHK
jgi:hypothetical protein